MIHTNISKNESGTLMFAGVDVSELARKYGTPLYLIDESRIREKCRAYRESIQRVFGGNSSATYASKALCLKGIYQILESEGMGVDVVSGGELYTALKAGFPASEIYLHGNQKADWELDLALDNGVGYYMIDNEYELKRLDRKAGARGTRVKAMLRLTPGIDAHTFEAVNTGKVDVQFGTPIETGQARELFLKALDAPNIDMVGIHCHIGSQIWDFSPYEMAVQKMVAFLAEIRDLTGRALAYLNLGGGFPVRYTDDDPEIDIAARIERLGEVIGRECALRGLERPNVILEPGRSIVADSGMTVYSAGAVKEIRDHRTYVIVDGGMTDNIRFALYGSKYTVYNASRMDEPTDFVATIAGRCCESGDLVCENAHIAPCGKATSSRSP